MSGFDLGRYRNFFGWREVTVIALAFAATGITNVIGVNLPINIEPYLALCPVIGLLFGMPGIVGVNAVSFAYNMWKGNPLDLSILDILTVFIVSYIPYRLWYSTGMGRDDRPPVLDSAFNTSKLIFVLVVSSVVYTLLYNVTYTFLDGSLNLELDDLGRLLKVMSFSFLFGMSAILILRYLGVRFETPRYGGTPDGIRRRLDRRFYDVCLAVGITLPNAAMIAFPSHDVFVAMAATEYVLLLVFLTKPIDPARTEEKTVKSGRWLRINKLDRNLIERFIAMFVIMGLTVCAVTGILSYMMLSGRMGADELSTAVLFVMSVTLLVFFVPAIPILRYIEGHVTAPVGAISAASGNFVEGRYEESAADFAATCGRYAGMDNEIGGLARSLVKMNEDMGRYIDDIRNLNSRQEMYRAELKVANRIQESLIPHDFDSLDGSGLTVHGVMDAAKFVGGDFYDFFPVDDDHVCLTVGDVSGKGVPAALFMAVTESLIESQTSQGHDPGTILALVNSGLAKDNDECMFVTCWLGIVELSTGRLDYACAGHNPPVLKRAGEPCVDLPCRKGLVLGAMEGMEYGTESIVLGRGDAVLLYTDGVTEANHEYDGFFGTDRLRALVDAGMGDPAETVGSVRSAVADFTGGAEQFDDVTMLMFRYDGRDPTS